MNRKKNHMPKKTSYSSKEIVCVGLWPKHFFWHSFSKQFTFIINMIMAMTKILPSNDKAIQWCGKKWKGKGLVKATILYYIVGRNEGAQRKLPEITCKHIFMKFYDFLNRKYSLWLCTAFFTVTHHYRWKDSLL